MDFFAQSIDVSLIRKSHESIIRGPENFVRKSVKEAKFHKMCHFE